MTAFEARGATKRFGNVLAVDDVSLTLQPGEIHGLIGPNGSGKTTLLNLLSGFYALSSGTIALDGADLTGSTVVHRARLGVARTFQKPRILGSLTVLDNAMLGGWHGIRSGFLETAFAMPRPRREEAAVRARALEILEGIGLANVAHRRADLLEHTAQRFLEIARTLCMRPRFLLLDEPAGGLTIDEIDRLGSIIQVVRDSGVGVLLVEHHTDFVFRVCDRVTTLDLGRVIAHGSPADVRVHPDVVRVYLGA